MVRDGVFLMVLGMGTVFAFLTAVVTSLSIMAAFFRRSAYKTSDGEEEHTLRMRIAAASAAFAYDLQRRGNDETR